MTDFGDGLFKEVIKVKRGNVGGLYFNDWHKKKGLRHRHVHTHRKDHVKTKGEGGHAQAEERLQQKPILPI